MMTDSEHSLHWAEDRQGYTWPLILAVLIWLAFFLGSYARYQPAGIVLADARPDVFSAERAEAVFQRLYQNATPHPAGNNEAFRQQVIDEFESLGYQVELHRTSAAPNNLVSSATSVPLVNLIVRLPGKKALAPVMLAAHYDSHPNSPGAGDDGAAVAAMLEIARMLKDEGPQDRPIIFFLSDGEEFGMIGAQKFCEQHALAQEIAAVINLEARGTDGPSMMFQTSPASWWLINQFAANCDHPYASSLFYEVYKTLPNNTDFTIFLQHGMQGYNFAFIGDVKNYHMPTDNIDNVSLRCVQHHGQNALPLLRMLANTDIESQSARQAVYFDVFGKYIVRWPAEWSIGFAVFALTLILWFWANREDRKLRPVSLVFGLLMLAAVYGIGLAIDFGLRLDERLATPFPDSAFLTAGIFWTGCLTGMLAITWIFKPQLDFHNVWLGVWLTWCIAAFACSIFVTGASYLFIVPVVLVSVGCLLARPRKSSWQQPIFLALMSVIAVGIIWIPLERLFYDALGFSRNQFLVARLSIVLSSILPAATLCSRRRLIPVMLMGVMASSFCVIWPIVLQYIPK